MYPQFYPYSDCQDYWKMLFCYYVLVHPQTLGVYHFIWWRYDMGMNARYHSILPKTVPPYVASSLSRTPWSSSFGLRDRLIRRLRNILPGFITLQAWARCPMRDSNSRLLYYTWCSYFSSKRSSPMLYKLQKSCRSCSSVAADLPCRPPCTYCTVLLHLDKLP